MRGPAILFVLFVAGCAQPPATFKPVDLPAQPKADWVFSGPAKEEPAASATFAEEPGAVSVIRVTAAAEDFYGSKLYDGFDVLVQPLDAQDRPVKRLGSMTATLYRFDAEGYSGEGEKLIEWHVSARRMAGLWAEGGLDRGFRMKLAWDRRPMVEDVKLDVKFVTQDGKAFEKIISAGSVDQPRYRWLEK